jgi:general secretion pathway protein J
MTPPASTRGFTLVEMVVALLIFAVLAGAGVTLLRASVDTQEAVDGALADLGSAARLRALLAADLSQAVARPINEAPRGFAGSGGALHLVRGFEPAERIAGASGLQAIRWQVEGDRLVRQSVTPEGSAVGPAATLARDVASVALRYRAADGGWRGVWAPELADEPLPRAVELRLQRRGEQPVTVIVALPAGPAPPKVPA